MQLINDLSSDLQKLLKYFNGAAIAVFFRIPLAALSAWAAVFPNNVALYLKDLKVTSLATSALKLVASSLD